MRAVHLCAFILALLAAPVAVHAGPIPYNNDLGITVVMEEEGSASADPGGRLSAAIVRLEGTLGAAAQGEAPRVDSAGGQTVAAVARKFANDPGQIHMLMAADSGGGVCHIRAPAKTEVQAHIPQLLLLCLANFTKAGTAATPVAPKPKPTAVSAPKAAANAPFAQNWAKVDGVYFRLIGGFGVGGGASIDFEPIILFKDGTYVEIRDQALEDINLTADRQARPRSWGKWSKAGTKFILTGSSGKPNDYELQQGAFFKAYPATAAKLLPAYERLSGGGNSALGGEVTIAIKSRIGFTADGRFTEGSDVGATSSGSMSGVGTAVGSRKSSGGTYTLKDHTLTLTYADGRVERKFFAFASEKTPPRPDAEMIFIGDSVYTSDD